MKKIKAFLLVCSMTLVVNCFTGQSVHAQQTDKNQLELRLDNLLAKMTEQEKIEQLYYSTDGNDRLKIPQFKGSDGPHGIGNGAKGFSSFPVTIGMAATRNSKFFKIK